MVPEKLVQSILFQIAFTLKYLHAKNIFHRNIKMENFFIKSLNQEIILFLSGFCCSENVTGYGQLGGQVQIGTRHYMSPEMMDRTVSTHYSIDIWSLGVLIYYLCNNKVELFSFLLIIKNKLIY